MTHNQKETDILERGNIYFLYRPKVEREEVNNLDDVQGFYMVLEPHGKQSYRLIVIGQKQLPDVEKKQSQAWGFVESVKDNAKELEKSLRAKTYSTKTRGDRELPTTRSAGEGVYELVEHNQHTHLVYALELPENPGEAQEDLQIEPEASYVLSIKNPAKGSPANTGLSSQQKADFPKSLQNQFRDRRFAAANPPDFLDYTGAEFILTGASDDVSEELGIELNPQQETEATAEILNNLRMRKTRHPIKPLFEGDWD